MLELLFVKQHVLTSVYILMEASLWLTENKARISRSKREQKSIASLVSVHG